MHFSRVSLCPIRVYVMPRFLSIVAVMCDVCAPGVCSDMSCDARHIFFGMRVFVMVSKYIYGGAIMNLVAGLSEAF